MRQERPGQTIQPTELVHEAYLRLAGELQPQWQGRSHFLAAAALAMRRILVDRARKKLAEKHGGGGDRVPLDEGALFHPERSQDLINLEEALTRLAKIAPRQARVVALRFFGGVTLEEIAEMENISARTVKRDWNVARAWLHREISGDAP
jgi:RNA polymerase sigma factor (TIGR02999 family)